MSRGTVQHNGRNGEPTEKVSESFAHVEELRQPMIIQPWFVWAVLSATFAALMTILAKAGLRGIDPDFAQLIRTAIVLPVLIVLVLFTGKWQDMSDWSARTWFLLVLSGLSTCAS